MAIQVAPEQVETTGPQVEEESEELTIDTIVDAMDETWLRLASVMEQMDGALEVDPDPAGWDARHLLSHLVGSWQRVPVHAAYFLSENDGQEVPIRLHDNYWIPEWEDAPLESFTRAMEAGYRGTRAFVLSLEESSLSRRALTPFGETSLASLLFGSCKSHIGDFHIPQLEGFLEQAA